jgi:hypothetical protein
LEKLCSNLAEGFHEAAQPLTILRASLDGSQTDQKTMSDLRQLISSSAIEVKRLCTLFNFMHELVFAESVEPELSATPILPLLASVADGVKLLFEKDGMLLRAMIPHFCRPVLIHRERTLEALTSVLLVAHTMSRAQDTVELIASSTSSNVVQVLVRNVKSYARSMNAEARLGMALAEANIRSQEANFSLTLRPFSVQIELRTAPLSS